MQDIREREMRSFHVYREQRLVLDLSDVPGFLTSTVAPPPGPYQPPAHPFIDAQAQDAASEHELRQLLLQSTGFDDYLRRLIAAGFDIASERVYELGRGLRVYDEVGPAGAFWDTPGQFTTLHHEPVEGELVFAHAMGTAYREERAEEFLRCLRESDSFEALAEKLRAAGFRLEELHR